MKYFLIKFYSMIKRSMNMAFNHEYKLIYFDVTALGEPIRFLFAYVGIDYEDFRFSIPEWPNHKPKMPFGQIPVFEVDTKLYNQSIAITRYVAKQGNLTGKDDLHNLEMDSMVYNISEVREKIVQYWYETDKKFRRSLRDPLVNKHLPFLLRNLNRVGVRNNGNFVREELSWVDIYFTALLNYFDYMLGFQIIKNYPGLQRVRDNVLAIPAIKNGSLNDLLQDVNFLFY